MAVIINNLFTLQSGDFELMLENGGGYRMGTGVLPQLLVGALQGNIAGNYNLVTKGGTLLAVISAGLDGPPPGSNQLFGYAGGMVNVCSLGGGIVTLLPNPGGS